MKETAARQIKNDLETLKRDDHQKLSKHQETITRKDNEIKRLNDLCKSLERLMNEKSTAEMEVRRQASGKDTQLKVCEGVIISEPKIMFPGQECPNLIGHFKI